MNAIIIAAGRGSRLEHHTDDRPKCMVEVAGRSILDHQLAALEANGIDDIHVIRGYLADKLVVDGATYHSNENWENNNILHSLFCAESAMDGGFLSTYSDIVYTPEVVEAALEMPGDINLVVDRQWQRAYVDRSDHPVSQAELVEVDDARITAVGKQVGPEQALGEFIGLATHTGRGAAQMRRIFDELSETYDGDDLFRHGRPFRKAYLADLYEVMIERGIPVHICPVDGGWREVDTVEDLHAVNKAWSAPPSAG